MLVVFLACYCFVVVLIVMVCCLLVCILLLCYRRVVLLYYWVSKCYGVSVIVGNYVLVVLRVLVLYGGSV